MTAAGRALDGDTSPLRVLLITPVRGRDGRGGDVAYTEMLVAHPPPGVTYVTYDEALADGTLRHRGRRGEVLASWRSRGLRVAVIDLLLLVLGVVERSVRRQGWAFFEPTWFVSIEPDHYDLVHVHLFTVRQVGRRVPVVSSAGAPLPGLYAVRDGWGAGRLAWATWVERAWGRLTGATIPWLRAGDGDVPTVYTRHFAAQFRGPGADRIRVVGTAVAPSERPDGAREGPGSPTIGFIGRAFDRKGGPVAVQAHLAARRRWPAARLVVATTARQIEGLPSAWREDPSIELVAAPSPSTVREEILPGLDVLVLPTAWDCGATMAVQEALECGVPVVTSTCEWLDERLVPPAVLRVAPDPEAIVAATAAVLADPGAPAAARRLWAECFSPEVLHAELLGAYRARLGGVGTDVAEVGR